MRPKVIPFIPSIRATLLADHEKLARSLETLVVAFRANDRDEMQRLWNELESGLKAHMDLEEESMIPALARSNPVEADALLDEHAHLRVRLVRLGVEVDLHTIRMETVTPFVTALRAHANREDMWLYRWADAHVGAAERGRILREIADGASAMATREKYVKKAAT